jgi:RES domain-containing protein
VRLERFPYRTLRADRPVYRLHRAAREAWWFSADGSGRFDPVGTDGGACYAAYEPLGAWIEVFRKTTLIAEAEVTARILTELRTGRDLRLADLLSRRALGFGVTASLGADEDYGASREFAAAAFAAGFDGVRYRARHDPALRLTSVALFGSPGVPAASDASWPPGVSVPIPDELLADAARRFGYRVLPTP